MRVPNVKVPPVDLPLEPIPHDWQCDVMVTEVVPRISRVSNRLYYLATCEVLDEPYVGRRIFHAYSYPIQGLPSTEDEIKVFQPVKARVKVEQRWYDTMVYNGIRKIKVYEDELPEPHRI